VPVEYVYDHIIDDEKPVEMPSVLQLKDLDKAYESRTVKYARAVLNYLTRYLPYSYSPQQSRIALNQLAHPIQQRIAIEQEGGIIPEDLTKDLEAIYGRGAEQLQFLFDQIEDSARTSEHKHIVGAISELTIFLLANRKLNGDASDSYSVIASTEAEDRARLTPKEIRQGIDFKAIRRSDNTVIPLQIKTIPREDQVYIPGILVVAVSDLIYDPGRTTQLSSFDLARAILAEIEGDRHCDVDLIDMAEQRLFMTLDNYQPIARKK
jgi:hypothetical protein